MSIAPDTFPRCNLNEELMAIVVEHRARGHSWEEAARAIEWDVADLRRACRSDPGYNAAYEYAAREVAREDEARLRRKLREALDHPDPDKALRVAEFLAKHLSAERRDQTRLEVESMRCEARQVSAQARMASAHAKYAKNEPQITPERRKQIEEITDRHQAQSAERVCREKHRVFLWKGCHKIGDTLPDETDVPLFLVSDTTIPGRHLYWAVTANPPADLSYGPFLPAPGITI